MAPSARLAPISRTTEKPEDRRPRLIRVTSVLLPFLATLLLLQGAQQSGNFRLLLLPPIFIYAVLFYIFARSLLPGREALITGFHRYIHREVSAEVVRYTRRLTLLWVIFFGASLGFVVLLAHTVEPTGWSWGLSLGLPLAAAAFFVGEHRFRTRFRQHYGVLPLWQTLDKLRHPDAWRQSREGAPAQQR